jgi:hypothetical protein
LFYLPVRKAWGATCASNAVGYVYETGTGQYIPDLPVSSEISVKGGKGIWGMPKHKSNLDFKITDTANMRKTGNLPSGLRLAVQGESRNETPQLRGEKVFWLLFLLPKK